MDLNNSGLDQTGMAAATDPVSPAEPSNTPVEPGAADALAAGESITVAAPAAVAPAALADAPAAEERVEAEAAEPALVEVPAASADVGDAAPASAEAEAASAEPTLAEAPASAAEPSSAAPAVESGLPAEPLPFKRGDLIEATIVSTTPLQVTVDLGDDHRGIITTHEIEKMNRQALEALKPGEKITVFVVNPRDHAGNTIVSINRALEELDWQRAEEYRRTQAVYETRIAGYNKGGLIVRFGRVRGFVPQSQLSPQHRLGDDSASAEERWNSIVNEPITVKVMEVDRARNRLILSERMAAREVREKRKEALVNELTVGEVRTGRVVSLEDFGAFVDVGGAEGLVHLTEITWQHLTHPRDLLKVGQEVVVEVISIDREHKRIGLSMKRQIPDPWDAIAVNFEIGQLVQGMVTKLTKFGAFVQLVDVPEIEGLVHISELSERRVSTPREVVQEGDKLTLRVVKIDVKERRLGLSLKRVNSAEYLDRDMERNWGSSS